MYPILLCTFIFSQTIDLTPQVKDWENFEVSSEIAIKAPMMQRDIYTLLAYETKRYKVKPNFVFIDKNKKNEGLLNILVANMSILHLAYYEKKELIWSGSIYFQTERGITVYSKEGYEVDIKTEDRQYKVSLKKDGDLFHLTLPTRQDRATWIEEGDRQLLAYIFLLPTSIPRD